VHARKREREREGGREGERETERERDRQRERERERTPSLVTRAFSSRSLSDASTAKTEQSKRQREAMRQGSCSYTLPCMSEAYSMLVRACIAIRGLDRHIHKLSTNDSG
jgi:hypothetical protein